MTTIQFENVDLKLMKLSQPRVNKSLPGFKSSYIQYQSGDKLCIQTPVMRLPWDIKPKKLDDGANVSAQLALSFTGINPVDPSCDLAKFMTFMQNFDARVKELVIEMQGGLGKKSEAKVLDANFRDSVKESNNGQYPPTIQPKIWLQCREGGAKMRPEDHDMDITVYNMNQERITNDNLAKNCMAAAIIEPSTVWCSSMGVGITWVAKQVVVKPIPKKSFAFEMGAKYEVLR
ncbi:unnamed protein product, partial [Ectocarpus sp. 8 AP-2014]